MVRWQEVSLHDDSLQESSRSSGSRCVEAATVVNSLKGLQRSLCMCARPESDNLICSDSITVERKWRSFFPPNWYRSCKSPKAFWEMVSRGNLWEACGNVTLVLPCFLGSHASYWNPIARYTLSHNEVVLKN